MGNMNIHITWLTHVRTGPKKKKSRPGNDSISLARLVYAVHQTLPSLAEVGLACETMTVFVPEQFVHTEVLFYKVHKIKG